MAVGHPRPSFLQQSRLRRGRAVAATTHGRRKEEHVERLSNSNPVAEIIAAIKANDAGQVSQAIERYPELKPRLNEPAPDHPFGITALMAAVQRKNKEMIDVLLRAGADINARSRWWAGSFGVLDNDNGLAEFLIERGAIVDVHAAARLGM